MLVETLIEYREFAYATLVVALLAAAWIRVRRGPKSSAQPLRDDPSQPKEPSRNGALASAKETVASSSAWWNHEDFPYSAPWWLRYPASIAVFAGSYWAFFAWDKKAGWLLGFLLLIIGLGLVRELFIGAVVALLAGLALWAFGAAVAAIPVSAAIIIGAMIIAQAVRR